MAFVYDAIDGDVGQKLREINPDPHFKQNHHQWLIASRQSLLSMADNHQLKGASDLEATWYCPN